MHQANSVGRTIIIAGLRIEGLHQLDPLAFQTTSVRLMVYDILEPAIGISVACMPLLQPLIRDTWLGNKLGVRGADRVRQIPTPDTGAKRL